MQIGGSDVAGANLTASDGDSEITVDGCASVRISRNVFRDNRGRAIDNL